jgi:hypothetical protein
MQRIGHASFGEAAAKTAPSLQIANAITVLLPESFWGDSPSALCEQSLLLWLRQVIKPS